MQIVRYSSSCSNVKDVTIFGDIFQQKYVTITSSLGAFLQVLDVKTRFGGGEWGHYLDYSIKNNRFGVFIQYILVFYSRSPNLEVTSIFLSNFVSYYNSIKGAFFITQTSRVIEVLKCNIGLINTSKFHTRVTHDSVFKVIDDFEEMQASWNQQLHNVFDRYLTDDQSALASGTLIGAQSTLSQQFKYDLISSGLIHVVVASGYNLTIVAGFVQSISNKMFPKRVAILLSLLTVWWYVLLALLNPAILRAGWMSSLSLFARLFGRPTSIWFVLALSVLFLVAIDQSMLFNISFQLSVFSTVGVLAVNKKDEQGNKSQLKPSMVTNITEVLSENFRTTVGANLFTLPITLFWFGRVSLIAVIANTLLLWIIPLVMYSSSVFLVSSWFSHTLAVLTSFPVAWLCSAFLIGVHFFANLPFAATQVPNINFFQLVFCYVFLSVSFYFFPSLVRRMTKFKRRV